MFRAAGANRFAGHKPGRDRSDQLLSKVLRDGREPVS
jgi:hypothetical protein